MLFHVLQAFRALLATIKNPRSGDSGGGHAVYIIRDEYFSLLKFKTHHRYCPLKMGEDMAYKVHFHIIIIDVL